MSRPKKSTEQQKSPISTPIAALNGLFTSIGRRKHRRRKQDPAAFRGPALECLETRQLMSATNTATQFDGSNDYIDLGNSADFQLSTSFTVSAWVNTSGGKEARIISKGDGLQSFSFNFGLTVDNRPSFGFGPDGKTGSRSRTVAYQATSPIATNDWVHLTATFDHGKVNIFVDGESTKLRLIKGDGSSRGPKAVYSAGNIRIGKEGLGNSYTRHFGGQIDEVSIFKSALSESAVKEIHNNGTATDLNQHSQSDQLISWYRMGDGDSGEQIRDHHGENHGRIVGFTKGVLESTLPFEEFRSQFVASPELSNVSRKEKIQLSATMNVFETEKITGGVTHDAGAPNSGGEHGSDVTGLIGTIGNLLGDLIGNGNSKPSNPFSGKSGKSQHDGEVIYGSGNTLEITHGSVQAFVGKTKTKVVVKGDGTAVYFKPSNHEVTVSAADVRLSVSGTDKGKISRQGTTYRLRAGATNTEITDPSLQGTIELTDVPLDKIHFSLEAGKLLLRTDDGRTLTINEYENYERRGWKVDTENGEFSLEQVLRPSLDTIFNVAQIQYYDSMRLLGPDVERTAGLEGLSQGFDLSENSLKATAYIRQSIAGTIGDLITSPTELPGRQAIIGVEGTDELIDWLDNLSLARLDSPALARNVEAFISTNGITSVTLVGHSKGGMDAVRAAGILARNYPGVQFSVHGINTAGVPLTEYFSYQLPNLNIHYIQHEFDPLHRFAVLQDLSVFGTATQATGHAITPIFPLTAYPLGSTVKHVDAKDEGFGKNHSICALADVINERSEGNGGSRLITLPPVPPGSKDHCMDPDSPELTAEKVDEIVQGVDSFIGRHNEDAPLPSIPDYEHTFDIGTVNTQSGTSLITEVTGSGDDGILSWNGPAPETRDSTYGNELERDYAVGPQLNLVAKLVAGVYDITFHAGDGSIRQDVGVYVDGWKQGSLRSGKNEVQSTTFRISHGGGELPIELRNNGGKTDNAVLNGVTIRRAHPEDPLVDSVQEDPALVVITPDAIPPVTWLDRFNEFYEPVRDIALTVATLMSGVPISPQLIIRSLSTVVDSTRDLVEAFKSPDDSVAPWALQAQIAINYQNSLKGYSLIKPAKRAVPLTTVESTNAKNFNNLFGKSDVILIDSEKQLNDGLKFSDGFVDGVNDEGDHREAVKRVRDATFRAIRWWIGQRRDGNPSVKTDILFLGAGFGATVNRAVVDRLAKEPIRDLLSHVALEMIDPISTDDVTKFDMYHPETRPFSLTVTNYWENKSDIPVDEFAKGETMDGHDGGGRYGQLNDTVQVFTPNDEYPSQLLRNVTKNQAYAEGQLTAFVVSNSGKYAAIGNSKGFLSVIDLQTHIRLYDRRVFSNDITSLSFSPQESAIAVMNENGRLAVVNLDSAGDLIDTKTVGAVDFAWLSNSELLVATFVGQLTRVSRDGDKLRTHVAGQVATGVKQLWVQDSRIATLHNNGDLIFSSTSDGRDLLSTRGGFISTRVELPRKTQAFALSPDQNVLITAVGGELSVHSIESNGKLSLRLVINDNIDDVAAISISDNGQRFAAGSRLNVRIYDLPAAMNGVKSTKRLHKTGDRAIEKLSLSGNGDTLLLSLNNVKGGPVRDVRIRELIEARVPHFSDEAVFHNEAPRVWIDQFAKKLSFFDERDSEITDQLFGDKEIWRNALPGGAIDRLPFSETSEFTTDSEGNVDSDWNTLVHGSTPVSLVVGFDQIEGVKKYLIEALLPGTDTVVSAKKINAISGRQRTTLEDLIPSADVEIRIRGLNHGDVVAESLRVLARTLDPIGAENLRATGISRSTVDLAWSALNFQPSSQYIEVRKGASGSWQRLKKSGVAIGREHKEISNLDAGTEYSFRQVSELEYVDYDGNNRSITRHSEVVTITTDPAKEINSVNVSELTHESLRVRFHRNTNATAYVVAAIDTVNGAVIATKRLRGGSGQSHTTMLNGLTADTSYKIIVDGYREGRLMARGSVEVDTAITPQTALGNEDSEFPWLDDIVNAHAPEFAITIPQTTVAKPVLISLQNLAKDSDGDGLKWSVLSSNADIVSCVINGESLTLTPAAEGTVTIALTVTDGYWSETIHFDAIADGTLLRQQVATLHDETRNLVNKLQTQQKQHGEMAGQLSDADLQLSKLLKQAEDLSLRKSKLENSVQTERKNVQAAAAAHEASQDSYTAAIRSLQLTESAVRSAKARYSSLDRSTRQKYSAYRSALASKQSAKRRLDKATKKNRAARKRAYNSAAAAAARAKRFWQLTKVQRDSAASSLRALQSQRKNLANTVARWINDLNAAEKTLTKATQKLSTSISRLDEVDAHRAELQRHLQLLQDRTLRIRSALSDSQTQLYQLQSQLDELTKVHTSIRQNKWVANLGLQKIEKDLLDPGRDQSNRLIERNSDSLDQTDQLLTRIKAAINHNMN